ncbi:hypothetical protein LCGC14_1257490 [marine sediment metagenome]|uniref:Uncharacterized protein n=1 Tax=marine sediment metagenome TaxID=412755 RepID=A0A0F9L4F5_9ZZZZ|nr:hypothetical protein [bacterium]
MNDIDVRKKIPFSINSSILVSEKLLPSRLIKGEYLETYAVTPTISIEKIGIRNKQEIFEFETSKQISDQIFVLARVYLYLDNSDNHISFYFDGFPWSYLLVNVEPETIKKIDKIYEENQVSDCINDNYQQIRDQLSRMAQELLNSGHTLNCTLRWAAIEKLNPQNRILKD